MKKIFIIAALVFCSCSSSNQVKETTSDRIIFDYKDIGVSVVVDKETGVEYLVINSSGVCPMFNPDGTIKIHKED